jgi:hypothetical protein
MHNKKRLQSFVLVIFTVAIVALIAVRTKNSWSGFARQTLRDSLGNELLVLSHLLVQKAQTLEDGYVAALNKKTANVKIIYSRILQKAEGGQWAFVETQEIPGSGGHFTKQIPALGRLVNKQWFRLADQRGESFVGLIIPIAPDGNGVWKVSAPADAKNLAFGVFKDPFSDIVEIFKGTSAVFTVLDGRHYVMAHSTEEYQGTLAAKDIQKLVDTYRLESFVERKTGKKAGGFVAIQKIPEINMVISAEMPGNGVGMKFYRWLFELLTVAVVFLVCMLFAFGRQREMAVRPTVSGPVPNPALPQKDFVGTAVTMSPLEKLMNLASGFKSKKDKPRAEKKVVATQVTGFTAPVATPASFIPNLESANLRPMIVAALANVENDIRVYGVQVEDKLDDVPDIFGTFDPLKKAIDGILKLSFYSVRQKMAKKLKIRLYRSGKNVELLISDNGLPRKTTENVLFNDLITQPGIVSSLTEAFKTIRGFKGDVQLRYDFHNGNQIIVRLPVSSEIAGAAASPIPESNAKNEEVKKRFNQFQFNNIAVNVRKPRVKDIGND